MAGDNILSAALAYAAGGQPVFPCDPATKRPFAPAWRKSAAIEAEAVKQLWKSRRGAMIGLPTGKPSGSFVIDIDAGIEKETGEVFEADALLSALSEALGEQLPATRTARTPRGGLHLYFRMPDGIEIGNRAGMIPRIDVRGTGGYVIAPPSVRADGAAYAWQDPAADIAEAPAALVDMILRRGAFGKGVNGSPSGKGAAIDVGEAHRKYALSALDAECQNIKGAPSGQRNTALHNAAANVAELVAAAILDENVALSAIQGAAASNPGSDTPQQIEATIRSGWSKGIGKPRDLSAIAARARLQGGRLNGRPFPSQGKGLNPTPGEIEAMNRRCCVFPMTDMGNAERFAERNRHRARWVDKSELWSIYDGRRWTIEGADAVVEQWAYETVRLIKDEARLMRASGRRDQGTPGALDDLIDDKDGEEILLSDLLEKWAVKSEAHSKFSKIKASARPLGLTIQPEEFDRDPFLINCENGTLQLIDAAKDSNAQAKVQLRPHDPADMITRLMPVRYDPKASAPIYDGFLDKVQPDETMRRFLHQWAGINLTGDVSEQKLCFWHGRGANGKSTLIDTWAAIMGDYSTSLAIESFLDQGRKKAGSDHTADLAKLVGVRMVRTSEPEKGAKLAEALIKLVTGNEPIPVREPYARRGFDLDPAFKLTVGGNHRPKITGTDEGIWRRVMLVPWTVQISDAEKDRKLLAKLRKEARGILNRMIEGLLDWRTNGLIEPEAVLAATAQYRDDSDPLGRFLALCVRKASGGRVQSSRLYKLYHAWTQQAGETPWTQMGFSGALLDRGFRKKQSNTIHWLDIETLKEPSDFIDHDGQALDFGDDRVAFDDVGNADTFPPSNMPLEPPDDW